MTDEERKEQRYLLEERAGMIQYDSDHDVPEAVAEFRAIQQVLGNAAVHRGIRTFKDWERSELEQ